MAKSGMWLNNTSCEMATIENRWKVQIIWIKKEERTVYLMNMDNLCEETRNQDEMKTMTRIFIKVLKKVTTIT